MLVVVAAVAVVATFPVVAVVVDTGNRLVCTAGDTVGAVGTRCWVGRAHCCIVQFGMGPN